MIKRLLLCSLLLALACAAVPAQTNHMFQFKDLRGRTLRLEDFKGQVVLLNFWATWCQPCLAEIPELVKWQRAYRRQGLQIIGVTYPPQTLRAVRAAVKRLKINYPVALGTAEIKAQFDASEVLPLTVVFDRAGNLRETIQGVLLPEEFAEKIKPLLTTSTSEESQDEFAKQSRRRHGRRARHRARHVQTLRR